MDNYTYSKDLYGALCELYNTHNGLIKLFVHATTKKDIKYPSSGKKGWDEPQTIKAGTVVRIWMVSRFGDVGITSDLSEDCYGYQARVGGNSDRANPGDLEDYFESVTYVCDGIRGPLVIEH